MHECESKELTKSAFRKWLILKGTIWVVLGLQSANGRLEKKKREQAPAAQNAVIYNGKCITVFGKVQENFGSGSFAF